MGQLILHSAMTTNAAFEAPAPPPDSWLVIDPDYGRASLEQLILADALVLGRKTYEGLAVVWPQLADDPDMGRFAGRVNSMPKYVASRTLSGPLEWNATLIEGKVEDRLQALKDEHQANLIVSGAGELAHSLIAASLIDEYWFWVSPVIWPAGPRILDGVGPVELELISATPYRSGVVWLRYRPAPAS
jgi:dihydrofolate reductase